jgi:hypothetical protein
MANRFETASQAGSQLPEGIIKIDHSLIAPLMASYGNDSKTKDVFTDSAAVSARVLGNQLGHTAAKLESALPVPKGRFIRSRLVSLEELTEYELAREEADGDEELAKYGSNRADQA